MQTTGVQPVAGSAIRRILETSPFPILLVCLVGIVLLSVFAPAIVVGDTWLTLMAGREVVENGLPHTEHLTVLGEGRTWTDQQWLAQVVFYAAHGLAGMRAVILLGIAFVLLALGLAFATARTGGASSRSTFVIGFLAILAGPWGWTLRAQTAALPLFAGVLWLLVDAVTPRRPATGRCSCCRSSSSGRTSTAPSSSAPAWRCCSGVVEMVRARRLAWIPLALVVLSPLCVLATPYGWDIVAYYDLMLVDAPFAAILREWQWSSPSATTALFWLLALVAVALLALRRCRARLTFYELAVLVVTFVGAVQAVRGVIWFALAAAAILPVALDGLLTKADVAAPRVNRIISLAALAGLAVALLAFIARPSSWFVSELAGARRSRPCARRPATRAQALWATDGTADWLLWRIPDLRGRVAYDVRFELYDEHALDELITYGRRETGWRTVVDGYRVVVVDDARPFEGAHRRARRAYCVPRGRSRGRQTRLTGCARCGLQSSACRQRAATRRPPSADPPPSATRGWRRGTT